MRTQTAQDKPELNTRGANDRGYAAVMAALLLVPLLGFAGFAVDIGAWYSRGASLQRAADAAALAGVVWNSNLTKATAEARSIATQNGYTSGGDISVAVTPIGTNQLKVEVTDNDVEMYFAGLFLDNVSITRSAVAEFSEPIPMGSPANVIGFGSESLAGEEPGNMWVIMQGHCSLSAYGDLLSLTARDDFGHKNGSCGTRGSNPYHDPRGYQWVIDVPTASPVDVNVFDYGTCLQSERVTPMARDDSDRREMRFTLYGPDSTPLTFDDNPQYGGSIVGTGAVGCGVWTTLFTTDGRPGKWMLRTETIDTDGDQSFDSFPGDEAGVNLFSVWANSAAVASAHCLTYLDPACPGVHAYQWMSLRTDPRPNQPATFHLAEIDIQHRDKTLLVRLWDPGEGSNSMEILDPAGNAVPFTFETSYIVKGSPRSGSAVGCNLSSYCLDVRNKVHDGQLVEVLVPLSGLAWDTFSNYWFKVRYDLGSGSADSTTWGVTVIGDPVRLVD